MLSFIARQNWDAILAYSAPRTVKVRDWRLGVLQLGLMFGIVGYIVGYNVVYLQRYRLLATDVSGSVQLLLRAAQSNYTVPPQNTTYCKGGSPPAYGAQLDCLFLDAYNLVYPSLENSAMFITTRVTVTTQSLYKDGLPSPNCSQTDLTCSYNTTGKTTYYIGGPVEFATISMSHAVYAPSINPDGWSSASMTGTLKSSDGKEQLNPCDDYAGSPFGCPTEYVYFGVPGKTYDIVPLKTLLRAAGVSSLDEEAGDTSELKGTTLRYSGLVLVVSLQYTNLVADTNSFSEQVMQYSLRVSRSDNTEFKGEEVVAGPGTDRSIYDRHGIRIVFKQGGSISKWDAATLLLTLTSSLALLAVAATIVQFVATTLIPQRFLYSQYLTHETPDFAQIKRLPASTLKSFEKNRIIAPTPQPLKELLEVSGAATTVLHEEASLPLLSQSFKGSTNKTPSKV